MTQSQLQAELEDAVREFPAAMCDIKDLRGEMHYLVCNFPGLEVKALYDVVSRYTDTTIVTEPTGNGQDRHVIKSKHTATLKTGSMAAWLATWLTLRNVVTLLVTLLSLTNLCMTSPIFASLMQHAGGGGGDPAFNTTQNSTSAGGGANPPAAAKGGTGFSLF